MCIKMTLIVAKQNAGAKHSSACNRGSGLAVLAGSLLQRKLDYEMIL